MTGIPAYRVAVLSGPNLADEIMAGQPAAATIACPDEDAAHRVQAACHTPVRGRRGRVRRLKYRPSSPQGKMAFAQ